MREIKFRGRNEHGWRFGMLRVWRDQSFAIETTQGLAVDFVDPATVGQFTGLTDSEGREIYEGDVVRTDDWSTPSFIRWDDVTASFVVDRWSVNLAHVSQIKVIGNIHDNPQLLKEGGGDA